MASGLLSCWISILGLRLRPLQQAQVQQVKRMKNLCKADGNWLAQFLKNVKKIVVQDASKVEEVATRVDFIFCAVDMKKNEIQALEEAYAKTGTPVISNNSAHRWTPDIPMVIPES